MKRTNYLLNCLYQILIFQSVYIEATFKLPKLARKSAISDDEPQIDQSTSIHSLFTSRSKIASKKMSSPSSSHESLPIALDHFQKLTQDLIRLMKTSTAPRAIREITDESILANLELFPTRNIPLSLILETVKLIWDQVQTTLDKAVFEMIMNWAISTIFNDFPDNYFLLIELILVNNIHYPSFQRAIAKARIMSISQVRFVVNRLLDEFVIESENYEEFNVRFIELASNYPGFSKLKFIKKVTLPTILIQGTPILRFIYYSSALIEMLHCQHDHDNLDRIVSTITDHAIETKLSPSLIASQYQLILNRNIDKLSNLLKFHRHIFLRSMAISLRTILKSNELVLFEFLVNKSFDDLLIRFIKHLRPKFSIYDCWHLLLAAEKRHDDQFDQNDILFTLVTNLIIPTCITNNEFSKMNLRLQIFINVISSIEDQNMNYNSYCGSEKASSFSLKSIGKLKSIEWTLPTILNEKNYELISTADLILLALIFIQKVFNKDYRNSPVVGKYLRYGKPNYTLYSKIFNDLLRGQAFDSTPIVTLKF